MRAAALRRRCARPAAAGAALPLACSAMASVPADARLIRPGRNKGGVRGPQGRAVARAAVRPVACALPAPCLLRLQSQGRSTFLLLR
jgi:hypothetical protein